MGDVTTKRLEGRNGDIWRLYCRGWTQERLADKYDITAGRISQILAEIRESIPEPSKDAQRRQHLEVLAEARAELSRLALEDAVYVLEVSDRMAAFRELRAYMEREAKMLGLDEAEKIDHTVTELPLSPAVSARLELARQREAEREARLRDES